MKKIWIIISSALLALIGSSATAQTVITDNTSVTVIDQTGITTEKISSVESFNNDELSIRVGGIDIRLAGQSALPAQTTKSRKNYCINHFASLEVGMNLLNNVDYSLYDKQTMAEFGEFMDMNTARSLQFNINLSDVAFRLCPSGRTSIGTALYLSFNDYVFDSNITLDKIDGILQPVEIDKTYKKSKINTLSVMIPVALQINLTRKAFISAGVYGGAILGSHTKIKFPKEKMRRPYINTFYGGLQGKVGYGDLYAYCNYSLSNLFQSNRGPVVTPITFGLGFGM